MVNSPVPETMEPYEASSWREASVLAQAMASFVHADGGAVLNMAQQDLRGRSLESFVGLEAVDQRMVGVGH